MRRSSLPITEQVLKDRLPRPNSALRCGRLAPALSVYDAEVSWTGKKMHSRTRR